MRAKTLGEVIRYFNQQKPLTPANKEEWASLYIDTERRGIEQVKGEFLQAHPGHKVLFGGHSGNGKSTELNKFIFDPQVQARYEIIKLDIQEVLNPQDIEIVELLLTLCFEILAFADKKKIEVPSYIGDQFAKMEKFFHDSLKIETGIEEAKARGMGLEAGAGAKSPFSFLKLKFGFSARMQTNTESRLLIRQEYRPRLTELITLVKDLLKSIKPGLGEKEPLLVIDGLDRTSVQASRKLFVEDGPSIALLDDVTMLLTVPISLIHSVESPIVEAVIGKMYVLKNIRLCTSTGGDDKETGKNRELMKEAIRHRLEDPDLIHDEALDMAIRFSGGVFRLLIDLIASAAVLSSVYGGKGIDKKDMEEAVNEHRIKRARTLDREHWKILLEVDKHKKFIGTMNDKRLELLLGLFVLEYINSGEWYRVNPLLESRLAEWEKIISGEKDDQHVAEKG